MKKTIWMAAGLAGLFLGNPLSDAQAEIGIHVGGIHVGVRDRPEFVIDTRPSFVYLPEQGFSVSVGSPYDIVYYGDLYYLYRDGSWYRSSHYRGPWVYVRDFNIPRSIRRHHWDDIRRYRDIEYRRHDRSYWEERDRHDRDRFDRDRHIDNIRRDEREQRRDDNRPDGRDQRRDDNRPDGRGR